ncbi:MAG: 2-C-methyl-D-erythritol 4-phosphate cytidylyltransferase [Clostridia bacterium]|nr:2-C-methyl-D-erythritol 4-phosphate cytidylyltransferase [Clostridia bacterium]
MIFAGILAGGVGSRMENAVMPKQFIEVAGVPIMIRTLRTFLSCERIDKIVVSMNTDWEGRYYRLFEEYELDMSRIRAVPGGDSRFTSLINVAKGAAEIDCSDANIMVSHDCARLFVPKRIIEENIDAMGEFSVVTTSLPVIDTVLSSDDGRSSTSVPDRSKLFNDQGPQTFYVNKFLEYAQALPKERLPEFIEAGKLYLEHGEKIGIIKGDRFNFKVTNDFDLKYSEFLVREGYVR